MSYLLTPKLPYNFKQYILSGNKYVFKKNYGYTI